MTYMSQKLWNASTSRVKHFIVYALFAICSFISFFHSSLLQALKRMKIFDWTNYCKKLMFCCVQDVNSNVIKETEETASAEASYPSGAISFLNFRRNQLRQPVTYICTILNVCSEGNFPVWWPGNKNSPTVTHVCCKRWLKWVPGAWGYNWATLPLGDINTEVWSSRVGVGRGADNPTL
jgi:hypothetical protein